MPSSTVSLQSIVDDAVRFGDLKPVLQAGGSSQEPALTIMNQVLAELCAKKYNWKWNEQFVSFQTIGFQSDYAIVGVTGVGWLAGGWVTEINSSSIPKRKEKLEIVKDLEPSSDMYGRPSQACWLNNSSLQYGTWGSGLVVPNVNGTGQTNPGPNVVYTNPLGALIAPTNPITQITDPNGNLQVLTTYGTCGGTAPSWPAASAAVGTTTADGTAVWTVVDPYGQGFRLYPIEAGGGVVWQANIRAQRKPPRFTSLAQFIDPVPDDYSQYVMQGFRAFCYQRSPEKDIRAKFQGEYELWQKALMEAPGQADREPESFGFYPSTDIMGGFDECSPRPDWPYSTY